MKKWIITILAALAFLALALTVHAWVPWLVSFAAKYYEPVEHLNTLAELISKLVTWTATVFLSIRGLWLRKRDSDATRASQIKIQTGGIAALGDIDVTGDMVGGNKTVSTHGDTVSGDKKTVQNGDLIEGDKVGGDKFAGDKVGGDKIINYQPQLPQPVLTSPFQLRSPRKDFTGRIKELNDLRAAVLAGGVSLQGQGGVGKTELAYKLAEESASNFPDAQIYLDLKGVSEKPLTAAEAMSHVLRTFHPEAKLPETEEELSPLYLNLLKTKRALLLMDNAKDAAQVKPLIPPAGCTLLVTSRHHFLVPGLPQKNLETLPPEDATELLLKIAPRIGSDAEAIAKLCGYLPQALRLAASAIAVRVNLDPHDYATQLADEKKRLELLVADDESVKASITLSYNLLHAKTQKRWRMLAVFPDTFDADAAAAVWEMEAGAANKSLGDLLQYSMLEWNSSTKRYRLHDLMRAFAHQRWTETESYAAALRHATRYGTVLAAAADLYLKGGDSIMRGLALFDLEWGNIQAGQAWAAAHAEEDGTAAKLCSAYPDRGAYILSLRQHPRESIRWREAALAAARKLKDMAAEGRHLGMLGYSYDDLGEYRRAIEYCEQQLAIARETGDRGGESAALGNLGVAYYSLGEHRRAIEYYEQTMTIKRDVGDRRGESAALGNLGATYYSLGEHRRAIEYHEQSMTIKRDIGDRRGESAALGNLGLAYYSLGEHRRATEYYEQQLAITREIGYRRGQGNALWNMSLALDKLGERKKAVEHAEAALKIYEQIESPNTAMVRQQLDIWRNG